jgi:hypothetical protein
MNTQEIRLDLDREKRLGFDEAVFAETKSHAQLIEIVDQVQKSNGRILFTRLSAQQMSDLPAETRSRIRYDAPSRTGYVGAERKIGAPLVAVVSGGSSDATVCYEATKTLEYYGVGTEVYIDVGVAGISRLLTKIDRIREFPIVISVAGMEGALHSVLGGLVSSVVIAVPTSVGYGVSSGGHAALTSALASCAPGIVTTNIDNGYGAACAALRILGTKTK